ncbi:MAG: replicative DNA helicase [Bacteroidetes bacterium]|nr:replicative DNA helicase [Bacteroidota bacterium]
MKENQTGARTDRKKTRTLAHAPVMPEYGKVPPQAVELEEAVLGAMMLEKDALTAVIEILQPEVFYKESHQAIFSAIKRLFGKSEPVDILTVTEELKRNGELEVAGGAYYITFLTNRIASGANIEYHSRILIQKFVQRELIRISSEVIRESFEDTTDVFDLLDKAESSLFGISESSLRRNYSLMQDLVKEAIAEIQRGKDDEHHLRGVGSGFTELDRVTHGWQKSDLIILASRPGMGKTAFALTMARNIAVQFRKPVAFFSLEMSSVQLVTRLIASETGISAEKLKRGKLENYEWEQLDVKIKPLIEAPLYIDDTPSLSIFELRAKSRRLKAQYNIEIIFIDYLQLMTASMEKGSNREQEISSISRSLKSLAKELNIPVIALSQLSREVEKRTGSKKPILSDLRESGAIEQDSDQVLFIYRPEYYKLDVDEEGKSTSGVAEISIAKNRNGATQDIKLRFISRFAKFVDYDPGFIEEPDTNVAVQTLPNGVKARTVMSKMDDIHDEDRAF